MEEHSTHFLFNLQLIFGGRMYTNFGIEILEYYSCYLGLCSYVLMIWVHGLVICVHVLVYFYSNLN